MALKPEIEQQALVLLKSVSLFEGNTHEMIQALVAGLETKNYAKGKVIIMEQEISKMLFILAKGIVGIWRRKGGEKVRVATLSAPDFFGETSMFTESPATALVKAEDECQVFTLARSRFDEVLTKFPALEPLVRQQMEAIQTKRPPIVKPPPTEAT
jgi:CRP/FNR family cyclic AMP-dependent transcriptional regulator